MAELKKMSSIAVSAETKRKLAKLGAKGDTYEGIILRLLQDYTGKARHE